MFGDKTSKDLKSLSPYVQKVLDAEKLISQLDNDGLRAKTAEFKQRINDYISSEENEIIELKKRIETEVELVVSEKEEIYAKIDYNYFKPSERKD